jgi:serine/threonine-protein kinase
MQAVHAIKSNSAFYNETDITPDIIGHVSPYYTASGVYCVQAFISHARGDFSSQQEAMDAFIAASQAPCTNIDLVLGRSGTLLASSLLLDKARQTNRVDTESLLTQGNTLMQGIWDEIKTFPTIQECTTITYLGMAHGWAGLLYATLCWCQSAHSEYPDSIAERLQQLAAYGERYGNGMRWRRVLPQSDQGHASLYMPNWCNGSAGYIYLWTLAQRLFGDAMYGRLAEQAAWHTWETRNTLDILCCGLAGQAYGLLNLYKHTGEKIWLTRAQTLAEHAALTAKDFVPASTTLHTSSEPRRESLYYGNTGIAVLAADLARPEEASMPFFEREC